MCVCVWGGGGGEPHNLCFENKYEKYQSFLSENFQFLEVKFSISVNWCVFIMGEIASLHICVIYHRLTYT